MIFHFLLLCVFTSIQNLGRSIPITVKTPERREWRRSIAFIVAYFTPYSSASFVNF